MVFFGYEIKIEKKTVYSKEDLQVVLDKLYRCRDLEINNLWQRSVFLSVFLLLCFTSYGYLIMELLEPPIANENNKTINLLCVAIASIGTIFSMIWILMAKSSKAWYEVYETAISSFEYEHYKKLGLPYENIMGEMTIKDSKIDINILTRKAGAYSPSKINIIIGQVSFLIWAVAILTHSIASYIEKADSYFCINLGIIAITITLLIAIGNLAKSSHLK